MITTIIIGKNSNLSECIYKSISNCILISSREIINSINLLKDFKDEEINIIFNNFQPATQLNNLEHSSDYITNAILVTSMILDYFRDSNRE